MFLKLVLVTGLAAAVALGRSVLHDGYGGGGGPQEVNDEDYFGPYDFDYQVTTPEYGDGDNYPVDYTDYPQPAPPHHPADHTHPPHPPHHHPADDVTEGQPSRPVAYPNGTIYLDYDCSRFVSAGVQVRLTAGAGTTVVMATVMVVRALIN